MSRIPRVPSGGRGCHFGYVPSGVRGYRFAQARFGRGLQPCGKRLLSNQLAFELDWVMGVSAHGGQTAVL